MAAATGYAKEVLLETRWVREHLRDPDIRLAVVDIGGNLPLDACEDGIQREHEQKGQRHAAH